MLLGVLLSLWGGCSCSGGANVQDAKIETTVGLPAERLDQTWVVQHAEEAAVARYANDAGWVQLVMKRDYAKAVQLLGPAGGLPAARAHAEAAGVFRQSALLMSHALIEVYGKTPMPSDPIGTKHLLAVSYAVIGDRAAAKAASDGVPADDPTAPWDAPWKAWLADPAAKWPPDLSTLPVTLPPPAVGEWPEPTDFRVYHLPELDGSTARREMADPGLLVALAEWHEAAARLAAPDAAAVVDSIRAGYYLPGEPQPPAAGDTPMDLLFGSDRLVAGDAAFLADLHGDLKAAAVDRHAPTSVLAELAREARVDGKLDAQRAIDVVSRLRDDLVARAAEKTGGNTLGHHRIFSDIAYTGALRSLALVAEVEGDREVSGLLRINALEHSEKHTACPVGMLALAAWDASNRYPMRAQDILHAQIRRYPSLDIARYGLDVLGLRVNSEQVGTPGM